MDVGNLRLASFCVSPNPLSTTSGLPLDASHPTLPGRVQHHDVLTARLDSVRTHPIHTL